MTPERHSLYATPASGRRVSVLVIDDDEDFLKLVTRWLESTERVDVQTASGSEDAARLLTERRWAAVVSDMKMPGLDGLGLLRLYRQQFADTPFVLVSACARFHDVQMAVRFRANDVLIKPLHRDTFVSRVLNLTTPPIGFIESTRREYDALEVISQIGRSVAQRLGDSLTAPIGQADLLAELLQRNLVESEDGRQWATQIADGLSATANLAAKWNWLLRLRGSRSGILNLSNLAREVVDLVTPSAASMGVLEANIQADVIVSAAGDHVSLLLSGLLLAALDGSERVSMTLAVAGEKVTIGVTSHGRQSPAAPAATSIERYLPVAGAWVAARAQTPLMSIARGTVECTLSGDGLRAAIRLPLASAQAAAPETADRQAGTGGLVGLRGLVVGDDIAARGQIERLLSQQLACAVDVAGSASDALRYIEGTRYDFIVSDLSADGGATSDLLGALRMCAPSLEAVTLVLSSAETSAAIPEARLIRKPVNAPALIGKVRILTGAAPLLGQGNGSPDRPGTGGPAAS